MDNLALARQCHMREWRIRAPPRMRRYATSSSWAPSWSFARTMTRALATRKSEILSFPQMSRDISQPACDDHLVHHLAGEPKIGCRIAHLLELRAREMPRDFAILRQ